MDLNQPMPFIANATMTTTLVYEGKVTLQELIDSKYLKSSEVNDKQAIRVALYQYSKDLDGGEFVAREDALGGWSLDDAEFKS